MFRGIQDFCLGVRAAAIVAIMSFSFLPLNAVAPGGSPTFTTIDAPGAGTSTFQGTLVVGIDAAGDVTGAKINSNGSYHGFVLPAGGTISTFNVTGAGTGSSEGTDPVRINSSGVIAGTYVDSNQANHGFVRAADGTITTFDAPGAPTATRTRGTVVTNINDSGVIVGYYVTGSSGNPSATHGFMRAANGTITNIDDPNAVSSSSGISANNGTVATSINNSGEIAGFYRDASAIAHGFVLSASGTFTNFDPPGVGLCAATGVGGTSVTGIDPAGDVAGDYYDTNCAQHGFLRTASGTITTISVPAAAVVTCPTTTGSGNIFCGTQAGGIGPAGDITGLYVDSNDLVHGFLRAIDTGNITSFDDPSAGTGTYQGTGGFSINGAGTIAGNYEDSNSAIHGFLYTPALTATTTTLSVPPTNPNPSVYQEPVTFNAAVSSSLGAPPNGENVTFMSGTTSLGTATLTGGVASLTTMSLPVGTIVPVTAVYSGDSDFSGSTSSAIIEQVNQASSTTTLTSSLNPSVSGQSVTFTANVSGQFSGVATGTVTFNNGTTSLGSASVSSNRATLTTTILPVGTDSITAVYSGDGNFTGSTSNALSQTVSAGATAPAVNLTATPTTGLSYGATVTLTATASPLYGLVDGYSWTIFDGTSALVSGAISNSTSGFVFMTPALTAGLHAFKAVYSSSNSATYPTGTSNTVTVNVAQITPTITWATPAAIPYGTALSATQLDATTSVSGSFVYSPAAGTTPPAGSDTLSVTFTPTDTTDYTVATATVTLTVNSAANPAPVLSSVSPAFTSAGGAAFTLTVNGSGFAANSTVYWGSSALTTTYVSATQLTAQVPASDIAAGGVAVAVTVVTPTPGGGTSNSFQFEVDSASGTGTGLTFTSTTATVTPGSTATYPVTVPSGVSSVTVTCLNLPIGGTCTYSSSTGMLSIATTSSTPAGTYQVTVVFVETVSSAAAGGILLPLLLLPLVFLRKRLVERGFLYTVCLGLILMAATAFGIGCGGGSSNSSSSSGSTTQQATTSGSVTLTVN